MFSKFEFCGYLNLLVYKICGYSNLWVHKICDDTKFQVSGREYQNICVLCISFEQKNICAFFHICFLPYVQNIPCELGLTRRFEECLSNPYSNCFLHLGLLYDSLLYTHAKMKYSKKHIPPAVAIRGHTTLIGKKEK